MHDSVDQIPKFDAATVKEAIADILSLEIV